MPLQATSGAASYDAYGGGAAVEPVYIEQIFQTYLYTGNGSTQTITNGIDLAGKGGLTWIKVRDYADSHRLFDTSRGVGKYLVTNGTFAETTNAASVTAFNSNGFSLGDFAGTNGTAFGSQYASWTFRKQPKFFDVVTWTGDGTTNRAIPHNLGSQPGFITCKKTSGVDAWQTAHRGNGTTGIYGFALNDTAQGYSWSDYNTYITSTVFYPDQLAGFMNTNGQTYVAYLFAHNAGGFGLTGTDNVISCGSYTGNGSSTGPVISLGYEPQWIMIKRTDSTGDWVMFDNMRGLTVGDGDAYLFANSSAAESTSATRVGPNATGFYLKTVAASLNASGGTYIYIAIRRGPMKVPTSGTSVYNAVSRTGTSANATVTGASFAPDITVIAGQSNSSGKTWVDKLRGPNKALLSAYTNAEQTTTDWVTGFTNTGFTLGADASGADYVNKSPKTYINWMFGRAPSFFDEVCYTGTGSTLTLNHNLGVVPELMIGKSRSAAGTNWAVYTTSQGTNSCYLNRDIAFGNNSDWSTAPTATQFTVPSGADLNISSQTQVMYLFATCAGVSKVGSYTGNGSTQTINCGFTGGARFVLIKRTDSTGDWYVYDTARGMTTLTDPYLLLNNTAAESATLGSVTTVSTGFAVNASILAAINTNGASYIYISIA